MLRRRQVLAASATTMPMLLVSACAGTNPLSGPPPLSAGVRVLMTAVTDEANLIWVYNATMSAYSALEPALAPLLAEHEAHLSALRARIVEPPGKTVRAVATARPAIPRTKAAAVAMLRAAEQGAVTAQLGRLRSAAPSLAQLYASIAASEATHVTALGGQGAG